MPCVEKRKGPEEAVQEKPNSTQGKLVTSATIVQKLWNYCNILRDELPTCAQRAGKRRLSFGGVYPEPFDFTQGKLRRGAQQAGRWRMSKSNYSGFIR